MSGEVLSIVRLAIGLVLFSGILIVAIRILRDDPLLG